MPIMRVASRTSLNTIINSAILNKYFGAPYFLGLETFDFGTKNKVFRGPRSTKLLLMRLSLICNINILLIILSTIKFKKTLLTYNKDKFKLYRPVSLFYEL